MAAFDDLLKLEPRPVFEAGHAARYGIAKFKVLLAKAEDINHSDGDGRTALFISARLGRIEHLEALLAAKADPNVTDIADEAPLQAASRYGHVECVRKLIAAGADVNHLPSPKKTKYAETALCSAIRQNRDEVIKVLIAAGADPNKHAKGDLFSYPLLCAASQGNVGYCQWLLEAGADTNLKAGNSRIPLHDAILEGHTGVVKLLLEHGANPNSCTQDGSTPMMDALRAEAQGKDPIPMLFLLLAAHADVNAADKHGESALKMAVDWELTEAAELLRAAGAKEPACDDPNDADEGEEIADDVVVRYELKSGVRPKPTKDDEQLCKKLVSTLPTIIAKSGWEASPSHWMILEITDEPKPLERMAYFIRGCCNAPGRELADGPVYLGESYEAAAERFVQMGFLLKLSMEEAAERNGTTTEIQKLLKQAGQIVSGNKPELIHRLKGAKPAAVEALAARKTWYCRTKQGQEALAKVAGGKERYHWTTDRPELIDLIFDAFTKRNLEGGFLIYLEWLSAQGERRCLMPHQVCGVRTILTRSISTDIDLESAAEMNIRAGAAMLELFGGYEEGLDLDNWGRWGVQAAPRRPDDEINEEEVFLPSEFARQMLLPD